MTVLMSEADNERLLREYIRINRPSLAAALRKVWSDQADGIIFHNKNSIIIIGEVGDI